MAYYKISTNTKGELQAKVQVSCKDLKTGKNKIISKRFYNENNLTEAKFRKYIDKVSLEFEEEVTKAYQNEIDFKSRILTFPELMNEWKEGVKNTLSHNYYLRAIDVEEKFNTFLKKRDLYTKPLTEIKIRDVQLFLNEYLQIREIEDKKVKLIQPFPSNISMRELAREKILDRCSSYKLRTGKICISRDKAKEICKIYNLNFDDYFESKKKFFQYSPITVKGYRRVLITVFNEAIRYDWIAKNPATFTKIAMTDEFEELKPVTEKEVFSIKESQEFIRLLDEKGDSYIHRIIPLKIMLLAGLRNAEVHGLKWDNIDFENKVIKVRRNRLYSSLIGCYEKAPKTKKSIRDVPMPEHLISELKRYMEWFRLVDDNFDNKLDKYYVAVNMYREPINPTSLDSWLTDFEERTNQKHITCHGLRHTYCSILLSKNVPLQTVSKYMGHSDSTVTLKVYSHFIPDTKTLAVNAINEVI